MSIAIDGPMGSGKSTIAKLVAKKLNVTYIDTGAMYRAVALFFIEKGINLDDQENIEKYLERINISVQYINDTMHIFLNNIDVSEKIRTRAVSAGASEVAVHTNVRLRLVELMQHMAAQNTVVMDGRDIGSNVLPNAKLKIYLDADVEVRANRRYQEFLQKGESVFLQDIISDIKIRDHRDKTRANSPLIQVPDAILIDTTSLSISQTVDKILNLAKEVNI